MIGKLTMLVGIPCSGKSDIAEKLAVENDGVIHSAAKVREEFELKGRKARCKPVFNELDRRIINDLQDGKYVIYDATNIVKQKRIEFLDKIKDITIIKTCAVRNVELESCINKAKEIKYPIEYIYDFYKRMEQPTIDEGWDQIVSC